MTVETAKRRRRPRHLANRYSRPPRNRVAIRTRISRRNRNGTAGARRTTGLPGRNRRRLNRDPLFDLKDQLLPLRWRHQSRRRTVTHLGQLRRGSLHSSLSFPHRERTLLWNMHTRCVSLSTLSLRPWDASASRCIGRTARLKPSFVALESPGAGEFFSTLDAGGGAGGGGMESLAEPEGASVIEKSGTSYDANVGNKGKGVSDRSKRIRRALGVRV